MTADQTIDDLRDRLGTWMSEAESQRLRANAVENERDDLRDLVRRIEEVLRDLVRRIEEVAAAPEYVAVWVSAQVHNGPYAGPQFIAEMERAKEVLAQVTRDIRAIADRGGKVQP